MTSPTLPENGGNNDTNPSRAAHAIGMPSPARRTLNPSDLQEPFAQFRNRYPSGCLMTELLLVQDGQWVVRAIVKLGDQVLASGLAADPTIEMAEDKARLRALQVLAIPAAANLAPVLPASAYELQVRLTANRSHHGDLPAAPAFPSLLEAQSYEAQSYEAQSYPEAYTDTYLEPTVDPDPDPALRSARRLPDQRERAERAEPTSRARSTATGESRSTRQSQAVAPPSPPPSPLDLSDVIAQTTVELRRLGWTEVEGRTYLQRTYGKRSRQQLDDDELLEFLHYLQSLEAADESPF
ncbi:hypothetical protein [Trichothermofontia sp.]